jgi:uncharacterized protein YqeY
VRLERQNGRNLPRAGRSEPARQCRYARRVIELDMRGRLRAALPVAMKARDRAAVSVLRATLAALDNAEAVDRAPDADRNLGIESLPVGVGAAEVARRELTEADIERIVRAEIDERLTAADGYETAAPDRAELLRTEARVLQEHLQLDL